MASDLLKSTVTRVGRAVDCLVVSESKYRGGTDNWHRIALGKEVSFCGEYRFAPDPQLEVSPERPAEDPRGSNMVDTGSRGNAYDSVYRRNSCSPDSPLHTDQGSEMQRRGRSVQRKADINRSDARVSYLDADVV